MKKLLFAIAAVTIFAFLLSSCAADDQKNADATQPTEAITQTQDTLPQNRAIQTQSRTIQAQDKVTQAQNIDNPTSTWTKKQT